VFAAGIQTRVPATADQVAKVRASILAFTDANYPWAERDRMDIALAVSEACANAVLHAYPGDAGDLSVSAHVDHHGLVVQIRDGGVGMRRSTGSTGLGLGVPLMRALAAMAITSDEEGTTVELRFPP
jgi:anti-sigma regulatory factor (Ser/Thr protein kinase)